MVIKTDLLINNRNGASLLEVMIAMVILTVGFLGVMALSIALTNNNATAGKINTATTIAQAEVSRLNCLGVSGIPAIPAGVTETYIYNISPTVVSVTPAGADPLGASCINPVLEVNAAPNPSPLQVMDITLPYTVTINLSNNPNQASAAIINAQVEVGWQDMGQHVIVMNDLIM